MHKLHLQFRNADGSRKTMIIQLCHQNLSPEIVRQAMTDLIALKLFERNGVQLYTEIVGAKYAETKVTWLFMDFSQEAGKTQQSQQTATAPEILLEEAEGTRFNARQGSLQGVFLQLRQIFEASFTSAKETPEPSYLQKLSLGAWALAP
ncbi:DUF2922 domain-containing protein [Enterococcus sp. HY326]|uniref:DUF2922 domain-containing protein n=1 Tax=Enterococcus sp. HY326 TaxID=2971265 RepID=UPI0022401970|nr:DUF2922 family protein [Enterococcus sp. HY326]